MSATPAQRTKLARRLEESKRGLRCMAIDCQLHQCTMCKEWAKAKAKAELPSTHKYRAKATTCSANHRHPSMKEANRCAELRLLERGGEIVDLQFQPRYSLDFNDQKVGSYIGDFYYRDARTEKPVLEDVKGMKTPVYRLKKKLMKAIHGIEITET
jgi:hypothetical protein